VKRRDIDLTDRELDVMNVLWETGTATVQEVRDRLADSLAYTTVLTILRILEKKGHVRHREEGRAYRYEPLVERSQAAESALRRLIRGVYRGSPEMLMTQLVADRGLSEKELLRIRKLLDQRLGGR
jgi:predicted transcriptional regulator